MPYLNNFRIHQVKNAVQKIADAVYQPIAGLKVTAYTTTEPLPYTQRRAGKKLSLKPGQKWGGLFDCAWFHFEGRVPAQAAGQQVVLLIDINGEACIFDRDGCPVQGLTNISSEFDLTLGRPGKRVVDITRRSTGKEKIDLWADAGCNDLFGRVQGNGVLKEASIALCKPAMRALQYDFEVLHELMEQLPADSARRATIWAALSQAVEVLNEYTDAEAQSARKILAGELAKRGGDPSLTVSAVGHAHMDLAWLWPIRETIRKGARTFATALMNMDRYKDYVFGASQAQLYLWTKLHYPKLYAKIRRKVAQGRWDVQGAMWVEADTNVSGGESLVRQLLYGKRFFRQEFGKDIRNLWLPDVFGYCGSLPQILRKAGVDYFMTQKLSWSAFNRHPHHTFWWQGIDGTKVLAHLLPEDTYNSSAAPRAVAKAERNYLDKSVSDRCLMLFGIGDGGGGPGEEHIERLAREKNLNGLAPVIQELSEDFFPRLLKNANKLPTWQGELYLELHQGTYTTQARSKRYNRKMELALRELEFLAGWAAAKGGYKYPAKTIDTLWQEVLLYQFHDILPGSSIGRVYEESLARYAIMAQEVARLTEAAETALYRGVAGKDVAKPFVVGNSLSWTRSQWVKLGGKWQKVSVGPMGYTTVDAAADTPAPAGPKAAVRRLDNDLLAVTFNVDGSIASVFDKQNRRELLPPGQAANRLAVYEDPTGAWDIVPEYRIRPVRHFALQSSSAKVDGPLASLKQTYAFGKSKLIQEIVLTQGSRRIDFITTVDWNETDKMLRTSFPLDINAAHADCEIQYGSIRRPTHQNTTWDAAKFEICAHKWVDISQSDYGAALLNDCKYGYRVFDNVLDLNLLRSTCYPDPTADRARHEFTYSLYPHAGNYVAGKVVREAYELNVPLRAKPATQRAGKGQPSLSLLTLDHPNVVVEAVKKAQDGEGIIVRLYETANGSARARLTFGPAIKSAHLVDLMEEHPSALKVKDNAVEVTFGPFEIQTVKVTLK